MSVDIATLAIRIDSLEARNATRDMNNMREAGGRAEQSTSSLEAATRKLQSALAMLGIGAGVGAIIRMADEYTKFTAQLRLATQSQREYAAAIDDVRRIANTAQQDLAATGVLYARIANGTRELGTTQKQVAAITETVNLALKVSGATAAESASAMLQLSQSFASGTLRGEEFNAVNEAAPRLMKALADGLGVPVGALKNMATEGKITSQVMADVLPKALVQLQEESKQVQTISGAFTVLKNTVMEFTATQAQSNGTVALLTGGIGLLAKNLVLLAGVSATLVALNVTNWLTGWIAKTYERVTAAHAEIAAANASRLSTLAAAEADVVRTTAMLAQAQVARASLIVTQEDTVAKLRMANANIVAAEAAVAAASAAGAQSFALRILREANRDLAVAETMRAALIAESVALDRAKLAASLQITQATIAQTTAQASLATATAAGAATTGMLGRAVGMLGGPIGVIITLLGLAATAWAVWGSKSKEAAKEAAESFDEAQSRIIKGLDAQIERNERLIQLQGLGMTKTKAERDLPIIEQMAAASKRLNDINSQAGEFAPGKGKSNDDVLFARMKVMKDIAELTEKMQKRDTTSDTAAAGTKAEQYKKWFGENGTAAQKMAYELEKLKKQFGEVTPEMEKLVRAQFADKGAAAAIKKEETAYTALVTSIGERIAAGKLEMSGYAQLSEAQKLTIKLEEAEKSGKRDLTPAHIERAKALIAVVASQDAVIASNKRAADGAAEYAKFEKAHQDEVRKSIENAYKEAEKNEELALTFGMTKSAIELLELARLEDQLAQRSSIGLTLDEVTHLENLIDAKKRSAAAVGSVEAMEAQKKANEQMVEEYKRTVEKYEDVFRTGFADMLNNGKSGWASFTKSLTTTFKTGVADQIYKMLAQPFVVKMVGNFLGMTGGGIAGAAQAASGAGGALSAAGGASSLYNAASGGMAGLTNMAGSGIASMGGLIGSSSMSAFGAGFAGAGTGMMTAAETFAGAGMAAEATAASLGSAFAAAVPWVGAALAAVAVWNKFFESGPEEHTRLQFASNNAAGNISINERGNEGKNDSYITGSGKSALGTFGVNSTFWMDAGGEVVQSFIKTVSQTDDALAAFMTSAEKASVTGYLTGKTYTANTGAEGSNPNANGELDKVFTDRINNILTGVEPGLASLVAGFAGTSQALATEAAALLSFRAALKDSGEAVFGVKVTMQEIAALKQPTETTSAALARVTSEFAATSQVAQMLGVDVAKAFGATGLASESARAQLILLSGDLQTFSSQSAAFAQTYLTDEERSRALVKHVGEQMAALGYASITTKDQFKELVLGLVTSGAVATEAGAKQYAALMNVAAGFATAADAATAAVAKAQEAAKVTASLNGQIYDLTHTDAEALARQRQLELDAMTATDAALQKRIYALTDEKAAAAHAAEAASTVTAAMQKSYSDLGGALASTITKAEEAAKSLRAMNDALLTGESSILSPEAKYAEAKRQFETAGADKLQGAEQAFLAASKAWFGGSAGYAADFAAVISRNNREAAAQDAVPQSVAAVWRAIQAAMGSIGAHANGGVASGWSLVGERGPEIVNFDQPARVYTASQSREMMGGGGGGESPAARESAALLRELLQEARTDKVQRAAVSMAQSEEMQQLRAELVSLKRKVANA